jgi:hypothetical protein
VKRQPMFKPLYTWRSAISTPESGLTPTEHHVLLTLSLHMNELGASCFPSIETLVDETCGRSASTIREALGHADELGWLNRSVRVGRGRSNEYEALNPSWYETHRGAVVLPASVDARRAAAIEAATAALAGPHAPLAGPPAETETRRAPVGISRAAAEPVSAALRQETRRAPVVNPPGSGYEDHKRASRRAAAEPEGEERESPAAAEPARDAEVRAIVEALPGADVESAKRIVPLAHGLPAPLFHAAVEKLQRRIADGSASNPCGLLTHLLQIARAERAAAISQQLAVSLGGGRAYTPAPWAVESLKRDDPERYTRLVAKTLDPELIREALAGHRDLDDFVELARQVRAGAEPGDQLGSPEQERRRWVARHTGTDPDVDHVIDAWDDVDPAERQDLHELAEQAREQGDEKAAAA